MESSTLNPIETNYWKVDIQYLQKSQLLVVAKTAEDAIDMVGKNIAEGTEQFQINGATELTDEEKMWVLKNMQEDPSPENTEAETRTLN